eukprot:g25508.t1
MATRGGRSQPSLLTFNQAIALCAKCHDWKKAFYILEDLKWKNTEADVITSSSAMSACSRSRSWAKALQLFSTAKLQGNVITFGIAVSACEKGEQWEGAPVDFVISILFQTKTSMWQSWDQVIHFRKQRN